MGGRPPAASRFARISGSPRKKRKNLSKMPRVAGFALAWVLAATTIAPARAACEFTIVKQQIDTVLDRDAQRGAKFRHEVTTGGDSIAALEALVSPEIAKKIDICRFETAEYLTKRGFPPTH